MKTDLLRSNVLWLRRAGFAVLLAAGLALGPSFADPPIVVDLASDPDAVRFDGIEIGDRAGVRMAACDINGDGLDDLVIGADQACGPENSRGGSGEVYVIFGHRKAWRGPQSLATDKDMVIYGETYGDDLGFGVACGDVNGDGFGDLVLCAPIAYQYGWPIQGAAYIVFGGSSLPSAIDLLTEKQTVIHGDYQYGQLCTRPVVADVNGDGVRDVLLGDEYALDRAKINQAGRAYILFGRAQWPSMINLGQNSADVYFYGASKNDHLGVNLAAGDLDSDGTADVVIGAAGGDGLNNIRSAAGDINVFRGRTTWPKKIDLAVTSPDMLIYGADAGDQAGGVCGLAVGDLNADGVNELEIGASLAASRDNARPQAGEVRLYEPGSSWLVSVDLATETQSIIYGATTNDWYSAFESIGDVNADGTADLVASSVYGDGPGESRSNCGEISVFFGKTGFPFESDLAVGESDILIYGALAEDSLSVMAKADLNGDGIDEIAASSAGDSETQIPSVWLISPFDQDGDGISNLPDNCPLVSNPDQADTDGDDRGDACALDWDADGLPDSADCAPGNPAGGTPPEITGLSFQSNSHSAMTWQGTPLAATYDISRGDLPRSSSGDFGACQNSRDPNLADTFFDDADIPLPGQGFFYLIRGQNTLCGGPGTWGTRSDGQQRLNTNPAACP